jgi:hypothetical protein
VKNVSKFRVYIHQPLITEIEASTREEAWEILQSWLDEQVELVEVKEVTLQWLLNSNHPHARKFREVASGTPPNECVLCDFFFKGKIDRIDESEIEHFQQIVDVADLPLKIVSLK